MFGIMVLVKSQNLLSCVCPSFQNPTFALRRKTLPPFSSLLEMPRRMGPVIFGKRKAFKHDHFTHPQSADLYLVVIRSSEK